MSTTVLVRHAGSGETLRFRTEPGKLPVLSIADAFALKHVTLPNCDCALAYGDDGYCRSLHLPFQSGDIVVIDGPKKEDEFEATVEKVLRVLAEFECYKKEEKKVGEVRGCSLLCSGGFYEKARQAIARRWRDRKNMYKSNI
jgi:hypothetical protein